MSGSKLLGYTNLSYGPGRGSERASVYRDEDGRVYRHSTSTHPGHGKTVSLRKGDKIYWARPCECPEYGEGYKKHQGDCDGWVDTGPVRRVLTNDDGFGQLTGIAVRVTKGSGGTFSAYQVDDCDAEPSLFFNGKAWAATSVGDQPLEWEICRETRAHLNMLNWWDGEDRVVTQP